MDKNRKIEIDENGIERMYTGKWCPRCDSTWCYPAAHSMYLLDNPNKWPNKKLKN